MSRPTKLKPHGTRARYMQHLRAGEDACDECKDANATFQSQYLENNPDQVSKKNWYTRTLTKAVRNVAHNHPEELEAEVERIRRDEPWEGVEAR